MCTGSAVEPAGASPGSVRSRRCHCLTGHCRREYVYGMRRGAGRRQSGERQKPALSRPDLSLPEGERKSEPGTSASEGRAGYTSIKAVGGAASYSPASLRRSAFSAIWSWFMHSWMSPSMNTGRLYIDQFMRWSVTRPWG